MTGRVTQKEIDGIVSVFESVENDPIAANSAFIMTQKLKRVFCDDLWLPIETAPKDGTRVLVSDSDDIRIAWYGNDDNNPDENYKEWLYGTGDAFSTGYYFIPTTPTHWQPLPNPPKAEVNK